jgi:hypothetical protein
VNPDLAPGGGVERHQRVVAGEHVDDVVDDDRVEDVGNGVAGGIGPGDAQLVEVRLVDLIEREVSRVIGTATEVGPGRASRLRVAVFGRRRRGTENQQRSSPSLHSHPHR